jgi:2-dehydro-3-deoxygalactonokinase
MGRASLLACDWGTTNLRAWTLDADGEVVADADFPLGVGRLGPGEAALRFQREVRPALGAGGLPAMLCGMIGSTLGWTLAPYADCPAGAGDLSARLTMAADRVWIAPGLRCAGIAGGPDVMRGEETQVIGWLALDPERRLGRHLICHPGTHAKWAVVEDGKIMSFATAMTGELFSLLHRYSVLKSDDPPDDPQAFDQGVDAAGDGDALAARLFTARARVVGDGADPSTTSSFLSGLLIGAEIASVPRLLGPPPHQVMLLGDPQLCGHYARALARRDLRSETFDGEKAAVAGLLELYRNGAVA